MALLQPRLGSSEPNFGLEGNEYVLLYTINCVLLYYKETNVEAHLTPGYGPSKPGKDHSPHRGEQVEGAA